MKNACEALAQLKKNGTGDEGAKQIARAIASNSSTLTQLKLELNNIGAKGAKEIGKALKINKTLTLLLLWGNRIGEKGARNIARALIINKTLTQLHLQNNAIGDGGAMEIARALAINNTLTHLQLQNNGIASEGAKRISDSLSINNTLAHLHLGGNIIGVEGAKGIARALEVNKTLTQLNLMGNHIRASGVKNISKALETNKTLTQLDLWGNKIGADGSKSIARALKINKTLTHLQLQWNGIGGEGAKEIARALVVNNTLTHLHLQLNNIGHKGAREIANALTINKRLTQLHLQDNKIGPEGAKEMAKALAINKTLTQLHLENNEIGADGVKEIARALRINKALIQLHLQHNSIGDKGAKEIAKALAINHTLTHLHLGEIGQREENYLIACLANNLSVKILDIGKYSAGIEAICERNQQGQFKKVVKIMVVGEARVGKTSFVRSLKNEKFEQNQSITRATEVSSIKWKQRKGKRYRVDSKVFDFGGQEIFNFIHPIFQTSQHAIVVLVANIFAPAHQKQMKKKQIQQQISNLRNIYKEILLVLTCFEGSEDRAFPFRSAEDMNFGLDTDRILSISNKDRNGIARVKSKIESMMSSPSVGWTISQRCSELAEYFTERIKKSEPIILQFEEERDGIESDLVMLHNSGWIFRSKDKKHIFTSDILITKMFQGLFRIPGNDFTEAWEIEEVKNGVISERELGNLLTSLLTCVFQVSNSKYMDDCCRVFLEFLESFSICWRVKKRTLEGLRCCVMFPSLLPAFEHANPVSSRLWEKIENKQKATASHIRRKISILEQRGSWNSKKVMDFIFPRLMVKLWDEMIDLELCWSDKFVLRGDLDANHLSLELENVENVLIITRAGNDIDLESIGSCFGTIAVFTDGLEVLVEEFKDCFGIPRKVEVESKFFCCQNAIESFQIDETDEIAEIKENLKEEIRCEGCGRAFSGIERIVNVWDTLRILYLLKFTEKEEAECESLIERIEKTAGELVRFPINKIATKTQMNTHVDKREGGMKVSDLRFHRLLGEGAEGPVYQCCIIPKAQSVDTVVVGKYMACKILKASQNNFQSLFEEERSTKALRGFLNTLTIQWINPTKNNQKNSATTKLWNDFASQFEIIRSKLASKAVSAVESIEQLKNVLNAVPSAIAVTWESEKNMLEQILEFINKMNDLSNESDVLAELFASLHSNEPPEVAFEQARRKAIFTSQESEMLQSIITSMEGTANLAFSKAVRFWATGFFRVNPPLVQAMHKSFERLALYLPSCPGVLNLQECVVPGDNVENSKKVLAEILKAQKVIFHKNELQILKELETSAMMEQNHYLCYVLHSFPDDLDPGLLPDAHCAKNEGKEPVVVDLMNVFDGTLELIAKQPLQNSVTTAEACLQRLVLFYQVCKGVEELKKAKVAHKDIKLANILINRKLGWACIADFGLAIRYGAGGIALKKQKNLEVCGVRKLPPEIKLLKQDSSTPVDKIDVFSLGSILEDLIICHLDTGDLGRTWHLKGGLVQLKKLMEKEKYEERLDIEDAVLIVGHFILLYFCYCRINRQLLLRILVEFGGGPYGNEIKSYKNIHRNIKNFILTSLNRNFSIEEKIITEILLKGDPAQALKLVQTRIFYQDRQLALPFTELFKNKNL